MGLSFVGCRRAAEGDEMSDSTAKAIAGLASYRDPTPEEIQRGIDATMRDVCRVDARHNPNAVTRGALVTPAGAAPVSNGVALAPQPNEPGPGNNWGVIADRPKGPAGGQTPQDLIERMTPSHSVEGQIAMLTLAQVEDALAECAKRTQTRELITVSAMLEERLRQLRGLRDGQSLPTSQVEGGLGDGLGASQVKGDD